MSDADPGGQVSPPPQGAGATRRIVAFAVAPFLAALFQSIVVAIWPKQGSGVFEHPSSMFVAICLYFYFFGLIVGFPAAAILRRRHGQGWRTFGYAGLAAGAIPVGTALAWEFLQGRSSADIIVYDLLFFALGGLAAGLTYWWITVRKLAIPAAEQEAIRPDALESA